MQEFTLTIRSTNDDPPSFLDVPHFGTYDRGETSSAYFRIVDYDSPDDPITVRATSLDQALVPDGNITITGTGEQRTITVRPAPWAAGTTQLRITGSNGSGESSIEVPFTVRGRFKSDFDGDGKNDLLWQDINSGSLAVWLMDGTTMRSRELLYPARVPDTNWRIAGVGDFNADGKPDIVWQEQTQGWVGIWLMNGLTLLSSTTLSPASWERVSDTNWKIAAVVDINNDGKHDLLWQEQTQGWLATWLLDGLTVTSSIALTPERVPDTNWKVVATGNMNGDLKADLIWQHMVDGSLAAWLMDGTTLLESIPLTPSYVSDVNWRIVASWPDFGYGPQLVWQHQSQGWLALWSTSYGKLRHSIALTPERVPETNWKIVGPK